MPALQARRLSRRYLERLRSGKEALDHLYATLQALLRPSTSEDPLFLAHGLDLLKEELGADLAYMVTQEGSAFETRWWSPDRGESDPPPPVPEFCRWMAGHPDRTMVLRDLAPDGRTARSKQLAERGIRAALGVALWHGGEAKAFVFAHFPRPRRFGQADLALLGAVAGFMSRCLEIEDLKASLGRMESALAITKAVMEDSSIQDPATDLPNLRYLDLWLKANLSSGRKPEPMAVALLRAPASSRKDVARLRAAGEQIRGGDLIITLGDGRFLLLLMDVSKGLAQILLARLRNHLGGVPVGATLWVPGQDDLGLDTARRRAEEALRVAEGSPQRGIAWNLVEPPVRIAEPAPARRSGPQRWMPKVLVEGSGSASESPKASKELAIIMPARKRVRGGP